MDEWDARLHKLIHLSVDVFSELGTDACENVFVKKARAFTRRRETHLGGVAL